MSEGWRCFVAVVIPVEVREEIAGFLSREGSRVRGVRWGGAAQFHLTLKFLGGTEPALVPALCDGLDAAAGGVVSFSVQLRGAGAFPALQRPRVVWAGVGDGADGLAALAAAVESRLAPLGFPAEERPFSPHLTLGRLREPPRDPAPLRRLLEGVRDRCWGDRFRVSGVHLMRSRLFPTGAVYSTLHESPLAEDAGAGGASA